jgi:hypothetical protein
MALLYLFPVLVSGLGRVAAIKVTGPCPVNARFCLPNIGKKYRRER